MKIYRLLPWRARLRTLGGGERTSELELEREREKERENLAFFQRGHYSWRPVGERTSESDSKRARPRPLGGEERTSEMERDRE